MMGYLDRAWCPSHISGRCKRSQGCYRVFTEEDRKNAEKWWGGPDFPINVFTSNPECFEPLQNIRISSNQANGSE